MSANEPIQLALSPLSKSWLLDLDGCVVRHNGYVEGGDELLVGVAEFWRSIPVEDHIIIMSSRHETERQAITEFLSARRLRVDHIILGLPHGERICINDMKPSGLRTAIAVNLPRDAGLGLISYVINPSL